MPKGIFNPFQDPKPNFVSPTGDKPLNTEYTEEGPGSVRLDGDSYVLELESTELKDVPDRIAALVSDIQAIPELGRELNDRGVSVHPGIDVSTMDITGSFFKTSHGILVIEEPTDENEVLIYRRLGYALAELPIANVLKKHRAKLVIRG